MRLDWFKFYPSDFLNSPDVMMMSPAARGCYITLLCRCWLNAKNGGGIPSKTDYILSVCNCTEKEWGLVKDAVLVKFEKREGQLFNPRLMEEVKEIQDLSDTKRENAQSGWETRRITSAMHPHSIRINSASHIDKDTDVDREIDKDKEGDFRIIAIRYRTAIGRSHSKSAQFKTQYSLLCREYGEDNILKDFEDWAKSNEWRSDKLGNRGLYYYFKDLPERMEELKTIEDMTSKKKTEISETEKLAQQIIIKGRAADMVLAQEESARIAAEKEQMESLRANPNVF